MTFFFGTTQLVKFAINVVLTTTLLKHMLWVGRLVSSDNS